MLRRFETGDDSRSEVGIYVMRMRTKVYGDDVDVGPWSWGGLGMGSSVIRGLLVCRSHVVGRRIDRPVVRAGL